MDTNNSDQSAAEGGRMLRLAKEMVFRGVPFSSPEQSDPPCRKPMLLIFVSCRLSPNSLTLLSSPPNLGLLCLPKSQLGIKNKPVSS